MATPSLTDFEHVAQRINAVDQATVDRYSRYWRSIEPFTAAERCKRWQFAALSIRSKWEVNRSSYVSICQEGLYHTRYELRVLVDASRVGLAKNRTTTLLELQTKAIKSPWFFRRPGPSHTWQSWRDLLERDIFGLGIAKVSFALEMCFPLDCRVVCLDTHILQMFGCKPGLPKSKYVELENYWLEACAAKGYPPALVRHILWDQKQGKSDTRYWSDIFESSYRGEICPQLQSNDGSHLT